VKHTVITSHRLGAIVAVLGFALLAAVATGSHPPVLAQSAEPGILLWDLGSVTVTGTDWSFTSDLPISAGAWESVTISNYGYCFVGPNDPRAGTAHAAAVFWYAELAAAPPDASGYTFTGTLRAGRGGNVAGKVTVKMMQGLTPSTHIDATLSGSDLSSYQDNDLKFCLLGSS
jgi:hypothetical protein